MQDRYAGDIGDFGKFGLLRRLSISLFIGVNWYLVPDESQNGDGRHTNYLKKASFSSCDPALCHTLDHIVNTGQRKVTVLEGAGILSAVFYSDMLNFYQTTKLKRKAIRAVWHQNALERLKGCDLIFLDPNNGLMVPPA